VAGLIFRRLRQAICAAAILATGTAGALPASPVAAANGFTTPLLLGGGEYEPDLKIAPNGTLWMAQSDVDVGGESFLLRSTDAGSTWWRRPATSDVGNAHVAIAASPDNSLYMLDSSDASSTATVTHDGGATWGYNPAATGPMPNRPWLASSASAQYVVEPTGDAITVSKSPQTGLTYPITTVAVSPAELKKCLCLPGNIVAEGTKNLGKGDRVGFAYTTAHGVGFARSTNGGLAFTQSTVRFAGAATRVHGIPRIANGGNGRLAAVWVELAGGRTTLVSSQSMDFGLTWSGPAVLVAGGTSLLPAIAVRGDKVSVSLLHADAPVDPETEYASYRMSYLESDDGGASFTSLVTVDDNVARINPNCVPAALCPENLNTSVEIDTQGRANVVWPTYSPNHYAFPYIAYARQV
jgi:hypothetical protein